MGPLLPMEVKETMKTTSRAKFHIEHVEKIVEEEQCFAEVVDTRIENIVKWSHLAAIEQETLKAEFQDNLRETYGGGNNLLNQKGVATGAESDKQEKKQTQKRASPRLQKPKNLGINRSTKETANYYQDG